MARQGCHTVCALSEHGLVALLSTASAGAGLPTLGVAGGHQRITSGCISGQEKDR